MYFDFKSFFKFNFRAFFATKGKPHRLTFKRFLFLAFWLPLYSLMVLIHQFFFLMDEIFYPAYHKQEISKPVLIIGNPRSGTTFLYRLLSQDWEHFTAFTLWELALAPSITQRKILWALGKLDGWLGNPAENWDKWINKWFKRSIVNPIHKLRLTAAEEDEHAMFYSFATELLFNFYPFPEVFSFYYFDRDVPAEKKTKAIQFYQRLLQRHLFAHGGEKTLLSKNPSHSSKIEALSAILPDARFIKLVRNPLDTVPSFLHLMAVGLGVFCDPPDPYVFNEDFMALLRYEYLNPVEFFKNNPQRCQFLQYEDLVRHVDRVVAQLYEGLELDLSSDFQALLTQTAKAERSYNSNHDYSLEEIGLTEAEIYAAYEEVFALYNFDDRGFGAGNLNKGPSVKTPKAI